MMEQTETKICPRCDKSFTPVYYPQILGAKILKGAGYCPECIIMICEEEAAKERARIDAENAGIRRQMRETCGIPPMFMNQDFSTFNKGWQDKALKDCVKYAEEFPVKERPRGYRSIYLWSSDSWGTGKTHLACSIIHRILNRWAGDTNKGVPRVVFLSEPELFRQIQATYSFSQEEKRVRESEDDIIKRIIYSDLVVLDDVGKEARTDTRFLQRVLFAIIDGRYKNNLPFAMTSNLKPTALKTHLDSASYDRLFSMTKGKAVRMDGKSFRRG